MTDLEGRVALVTGATTGIGRAIARRFSTDGARVIVNGRSDERCYALVDELVASGAVASCVVGDVRLSATADAIADHVDRVYGHLDVMVLNAGVISYGKFWEATEDEFDEMMDVNVKGPWLCARALHGLMPSGSSIILTSSINGHHAYVDEGIYCATKGAVLQLMRVMALELGDRGIRVNALSPGIVVGGGMSQDIIDASPEPSATLAELVGTTPLMRAGTLEEMADGAVFLAGAQSSFMTGQSLVLDGGFLLK